MILFKAAWQILQMSFTSPLWISSLIRLGPWADQPRVPRPFPGLSLRFTWWNWRKLGPGRGRPW